MLVCRNEPSLYTATRSSLKAYTDWNNFFTNSSLPSEVTSSDILTFKPGKLGVYRCNKLHSICTVYLRVYSTTGANIAHIFEEFVLDHKSMHVTNSNFYI